jgi:hypothetical protein
MVSFGSFPAGAGIIAGGGAVCLAWGWPLPSLKMGRSGTGGLSPVRLAPGRVAPGVKARPRPGDSDLYLDLDAVEVEAVYILGSELFTHLKGGVGLRKDPVTGDERHIETSEVSLTWRCHGRRSAERLAVRLNVWEARRTPLRLLAAQGRCALLMEDDRNWVQLPELRLAA